MGRRKPKRLTRAIGRKVVFVNPFDRDWARHRYILWFGQIGTTYLAVWANSLEDATEHAVDWIVENAPGHLADDLVQEEYQRALAEGMSEEKAQEQAETDVTMWGHSGLHYVMSDEWGIVKEDPSRRDILELEGRPAERRAHGVDRLAAKRARTGRRC